MSGSAVVAALIAQPNVPRADDTPRRVAESSAASSDAPAGIEVMRTRPLVGDGMFHDQLDLDRAKLRFGRYTLDVDGYPVTLTLDPGLQATAEAVLRRARAPLAAAVVLDLDGRILAMAGRNGGKQDFVLPLKAWAPAASVFKIVTAAALVDAGVKPGNKVCYHGGRRSVRASNLTDSKRDNQCHTLAYAIARSQNAIIAKLAHRRLRPDVLRDYAKRFGLAAKPPSFALPVARSTCDIPDEPLAFARVAAGFWHTRLSVLQGALLAHTVASGGLSVTPRIVSRVEDRNGSTHLVASSAPRRVLSGRTARALTTMMVGTTERGSARKGFRDRRGRRYLGTVKVAGKTGTLTRHSPSYMQYSWFVGFAPADAPKAIVAVLLGNPRKWHLKAHTAARMLLDKALPSR